MPGINNKEKNRKRPLNKNFRDSDPPYKKPKLTPQEIAEKRYKAKHPFKLTNINEKKPLVLQKSEVVEENHQKKGDPYTKYNVPLLNKKQRKERQRSRKEQKPQGKARSQLNQMVGQKRLKDQKRHIQIQESSAILNAVRGNILNLIRAVDSAKVLQTVIKYGAPNQVLEIAKELKGHYCELVCDRYAHFTVQRLLEYGKKDVKSMIVDELIKEIGRLMTHRLAFTVMDYAIMTAADEVTRRKALQFIISRKFMVFVANEDKKNVEKKSSKTDLEDNFLDEKNEAEGQDENLDVITDDNTAMPQTIGAILANSDVVERKHVLRNMHKFLMAGIEKEMVSTGVFQNILYQYSNYCDRYELENMLELCIIPNFMELQNVKEGSYAIINMLSQCYYKNKLRKLLLKAIQNFVISMCCDEDSYTIVLRFLEVFDDTKQLNSVIIQKMLSNLDILCFHDFGRLVLFHLLCPRNEKYFKKFNNICSKPLTESEFQKKHQNTPGVDIKDPNTWVKLKVDDRPSCKKDESLKRKELLQTLLPGLVKYCCEHMKKLLIHTLGGTVVIELLHTLLREPQICVNASQFTDKLINCLLQVSLSDYTPYERSPTPPAPEKPSILQTSKQSMEINDVVRTSLSVITSNGKEKNENKTQIKNEGDEEEINENENENEEEKEKEEAKKKILNAEELKASAEYQTKMLRYNVDMNRHKTLDYTYDTSTPIMNHGLGHRRLAKMVELFPEIHNTVCDYIIAMNENEIQTLLKSPGVYIICNLYKNCTTEDIKTKLRSKLTSIVEEVKESYTEEELKSQKGLQKLIEHLSEESEGKNT